MRSVTLCHRCLRRHVRFTDPLLHSLEKEEEILSYVSAGTLRPPSLVVDGVAYLIFNGNHRVLVAINRKLTIVCTLLEDVDDVLRSQADEGPDYRDISRLVPITFEGVVADLRDGASNNVVADPEVYSFADY